MPPPPATSRLLLPDPAPKPKRQRERDTTERDLQFEDVQQDLWMLDQLHNQARALELIEEALLAGRTDQALTLVRAERERNEKMAPAEKNDLARHQKRGAISQFKRREQGEWRPGETLL